MGEVRLSTAGAAEPAEGLETMLLCDLLLTAFALPSRARKRGTVRALGLIQPCL
jgi:hypothetical protein